MILFQPLVANCLLLLQTKFAKVMFSQVFVCPQGGLCPGILCPGGLFPGVGLCPGGSVPRWSLSRGVSVWGVSVRETPVQ